ncbi:excinuclease ABC subunit UvrA [Acidobacteriota bacterium]
MKKKECLVVKGAREHNLKDVYVEIPKRKLIVFTGVSGSGKTSLAFDTIYAEGQRRYVESLSSYARQFLGQLEKPEYDFIRGLSPTIALEQKAASTNPRSTVGTITEIYDYFRILYARVGVQHCTRCGKEVQSQSPQIITEELLAFPAGTDLTLLSPVLRNRKGEFKELLDGIRRDGFTRVRLDGKVLRLDELPSLDPKKKHSIDVVVDRIKIREGIRARLTDSTETALKVGKGTLIAAIDTEERLLSERLACPDCGLSFPELTPQLFSFNSPLGMCPECNGLGTRLEIDPALVVPDHSLSVNAGAVALWSKRMGAERTWTQDMLKSLALTFKIDLDKPFKDLAEEHRNVILHGSGGKEISVEFDRKRSTGSYRMKFEGAIPWIKRRFKETQSEGMRHYYQSFFTNFPCSSCGGSRLREEARAVRVGGVELLEQVKRPIEHCYDFIGTLDLPGNRAVIAAELLKEISSRLKFLVDLGLGYLSLDRPGPSLSGGESQRIRLASQLGSELTGVIYILDEPSIGLHQRDNKRLIDTLKHLRDLGNSVIVVEHDAEMIRSADHILDFGPGAGRDGGRIIFNGTPGEILKNRRSLTGRYLSGRLRIDVPERRRKPKGRSLTIYGARLNNLKGIDVSFPLGLFICVTGVSGAGKTSLIRGTLFPGFSRAMGRRKAIPGPHKKITGLAFVDKVININQKPIGLTPRSNPATYTKVFDLIREIFSQLTESRMYGYTKARFSFNLKGGRCEACRGDGMIRIEMHFLPDVFVPCEICNGKRFNDATLRVRFKGLNVADALDLTVNEAVELFVNHPRVLRILSTLQDVGLGYLKLGQPSPTLSGGEAQRIKLARELSRLGTGRTLYILDEPTTGLHFDDVKKLLLVLNKLVDTGNTVIVIEHNLEVIKCADYVVDLGPEGGERGGDVVATGSPEEVSANPRSFTGGHLRQVLTV